MKNVSLRLATERADSPPPRVVLFDLGPWAGHSCAYTKRLVQQFVKLGLHITLLASAEHVTEAHEHIVIDDNASYVDIINEIDRSVPVVDLDYRFTLLATKPWRRIRRPVTHVLHGIDRLRPIGPNEHRRPRTLIRIACYWACLRRDITLGHEILVHTPSAKKYLSRLGLPARYAPLPVLLDLPESSQGDTGESHFLFVGGISEWKGLSLGLSALANQSRRPVSKVVVVGCKKPGRTESSGLEIHHVGKVDEDSLWVLYRQAALVMVPYSRDFELSGAASLVLQEALYSGRRIVAGPWAAEQTDKANVSIARSYCETEFGRAVERALGQEVNPPPTVLDSARYVHALLGC